MCGIIYAHDFTGAPVNNGILQQFDKQRSRGTQGFGLFDGNRLHLVREAKEDNILKWLVKHDSNMILFHHRWPTSTINVSKAAHPFSTKDYFGDTQYVMVHNGIISNDDELYKQHVESGIGYQSRLKDGTYNDSEALLWDLALTLEGKQPTLTAQGSIAFICMKLVKGKLDKLYFGRNNNPLNMLRTKDGIELSSEGKGEPIDRDKLYTFNYELNRLTHKPFTIPTAYSRSYVGDYEAGWGRSWDNYDYSQDYDRDGNYIGRKTPTEYEQDRDTQMYLPVGTKDDLTEEESELYLPVTGEVEAKALEFLFRCKGNFEQAHWLIEAALDDLFDDEFSRVQDILFMEAIMERIDNDPEFINEHSVSSVMVTL